MIFQEQSKLDEVGDQVSNLQGGYDILSDEVKKLRQGLELNQEYWRGFSRGLKETRKTVYAEGQEAEAEEHASSADGEAVDGANCVNYSSHRGIFNFLTAWNSTDQFIVDWQFQQC
eukprot:s4516_g1.t1